jgi:hypothetical protein
MELWLLLLCVSSLCFIAVLFLGIQHAMRRKEQFITIEAQALNDVSQGVPGMPGMPTIASSLPGGSHGTNGMPQEVVTSPLRFRYVIDGKERYGHLGNPWGLPSVPHILHGTTIRAYFSSNRYEAFLDRRTTLFRLRFPLWGFILSLGLGLLLLCFS